MQASLKAQTSKKWQLYYAIEGTIAVAVQRRVENTTEPFICTMPSNDTIHPEFVEAALKALEDESLDYWVPNGAFLTEEIIDNSIMCGCFVLRRSSLMSKLDGKYYIQSPDGQIGMEDWHLWMRMYGRGLTGVTDLRTLFYWRRHDDAISARIIGTPLMESKLQWMRRNL